MRVTQNKVKKVWLYATFCRFFSFMSVEGCTTVPPTVNKVAPDVTFCRFFSFMSVKGYVMSEIAPERPPMLAAEFILRFI